MAIDYTIKAIPTTYNGRRYRSRLEARWAAYFDLLGFQFEYEPRDLGKWSPDFAIWGRRPEFPILVEVKPIDRWHRETARKMADACNDGERLLLLGKTPDFCGGWQQFGWMAETPMGEYEAQWTEALFCKDEQGRIDFQANSGHFCPETWIWETIEEVLPADTQPLWKHAANIVQWLPK